MADDLRVSKAGLLFARNLDWNLVKLFLGIVRSGGISPAARALNRQQPTISAGLKRLEDHVGSQLFMRSARGVVLTPAGRAFLRAAEEIEILISGLPGEVARTSGRLQGLVTVRVISDLVSPAFDQAMLTFHRNNPDVEIHLDIAPWRDVVLSVKDGSADIGIACDTATSLELRYRPIGREWQQLFCGPGHPRFGKEVAKPETLADEVFVLTGEDEPAELASFRKTYGLGERTGGSAETLHEVKRLIQIGIGIGFLPTVVAADAIESGQLWPMLDPAVLPNYEVYLITRDAKLSEPARALLDTIDMHIDPAGGSNPEQEFE
ncbi:LysR family transcriptional regulator [Hyphomicrobium sp.]|uniref:LysR family transcriptional regulator n=1 Tax=Hyphomicrobium sp. TaxID=82 RepID=UPI002D77C27D|nr:LysR family transcriptional regulator [Hyphomicrobium sp.]HET6387957.1 LysR family transcriptional regulator [Hyphomicrobium sp.]